MAQPTTSLLLMLLAGVAVAEPPPVGARPPAEAPSPGAEATPSHEVEGWTPPEPPASLLARLPPSARGESTELRTVDAGYGPVLVERLAGATGDTALEVEYTVDPSLEATVRRILHERGIALGHVILLDPSTGEVLAYVSTDPARFPAARTYPTASLMKVVTSAAALRERPEVVDSSCRYVDSPYVLRRAYLRPPTIGGWVDTFWRALAISNNQCFARIAVYEVGKEGLLAEMEAVGLLEPPAPGHPPARIDPIDDALSLGELGSGLSGSFVTPLGAARLAALLATGSLVQPWWVARVHDGDGALLAPPAPPAPRPVWPARLADQLREHMVGVTERGTARRAFLDAHGEPRLGDLHVSGKTGTLGGTDPAGLYQWFIGVAPADAPRIAIAALVVDGPVSASTVAASTLEAVFCEDGVCDAARTDRLAERARAREAIRVAEIDRARRVAMRRVETLSATEEEALRQRLELDEAPRPVSTARFDFPRDLLRRHVDGRVVVLLELSDRGEVLDASVESSSLPDFDPYVLEAVRAWRFTPPTRDGRPVHAQARLPIPIRIN
jgi:TonB family protein